MGDLCPSGVVPGCSWPRRRPAEPMPASLRCQARPHHSHRPAPGVQSWAGAPGGAGWEMGTDGSPGAGGGVGGGVKNVEISQRPCFISFQGCSLQPTRLPLHAAAGAPVLACAPSPGAGVQAMGVQRACRQWACVGTRCTQTLAEGSGRTWGAARLALACSCTPQQPSKATGALPSRQEEAGLAFPSLHRPHPHWWCWTWP